jgi:catechol 2,3-dioxygenase-like lactoylglutathione lyase family enzyme
MKLEVVVIPVSDVDRAKGFYERIGWRLNVDRSAGEDFRLVQFTPPGSCCSVHCGKNVTSVAPGSAKAFLIVADIEAARDQLVAAGVEVGEFFHDGPEGRGSGLHPERLSYRSRALFSDPDGNGWHLQEVTTWDPRRVNLARLPSAPKATWRVRFGVRRPPTASTRSASGSATRTGQTGTPPTWWLSSPAKSYRNERLRRNRHRSQRDSLSRVGRGDAGGGTRRAADETCGG